MNFLIPIQVWLFSMSYFQVTIDDNEGRLSSRTAEQVTRYVAIAYAIVMVLCYIINEVTFAMLEQGGLTLSAAI